VIKLQKFVRVKKNFSNHAWLNRIFVFSLKNVGHRSQQVHSLNQKHVPSQRSRWSLGCLVAPGTRGNLSERNDYSEEIWRHSTTGDCRQAELDSRSTPKNIHRLTIMMSIVHKICKIFLRAPKIKNDKNNLFVLPWTYKKNHLEKTFICGSGTFYVEIQTNKKNVTLRFVRVFCSWSLTLQK